MTSRANSAPEPISRKRKKIQRICSALIGDKYLRLSTRCPCRGAPPIFVLFVRLAMTFAWLQSAVGRTGITPRRGPMSHAWPVIPCLGAIPVRLVQNLVCFIDHALGQSRECQPFPDTRRERL